MDKAVEKIAGAHKRIIIAGGGVIAAGAHEELLALAEHLDAPVVTTVDGRGVIPETHPLGIGNYYNSAGMYNALLDADLTLAIGTKFAVGVDGQFAAQTPPGELVHIDMGNMIGRTHTADLGLVADAKQALIGINANLQASLPMTVSLMMAFGRPEWHAGRCARDLVTIGPSHGLHSRQVAADSVFVRDQTISAYNWGNQQFPILQPRTSINPTSGAIGPGFPMSVGAAIASQRKTMVIHGDGGHVPRNGTGDLRSVSSAADYLRFHDRYGVLRWLQQNRFGRITKQIWVKWPLPRWPTVWGFRATGGRR